MRRSNLIRQQSARAIVDASDLFRYWFRFSFLVGEGCCGLEPFTLIGFEGRVISPRWCGFSTMTMVLLDAARYPHSNDPSFVFVLFLLPEIHRFASCLWARRVPRLCLALSTLLLD